MLICLTALLGFVWMLLPERNEKMIDSKQKRD